MLNEDQLLFAAEMAAADEATGEPGEAPEYQELRGSAGQLRPYRDVRAGFEPWRRVALVAWAARDEAATAH